MRRTRFPFPISYLSIILLAMILSASCFAASKQILPKNNLSKEEAKKIQKEAKQLGEKGNQTIVDHLKSLSQNENLLRKIQDSFLAKEDEGKTLDGKEAKETMDSGVFPASKIEEILTKARINPPIDESDEMFLQTKQALGLANPNMTLSTEPIPEEEILETCEEGGTYARIFEKQLLVTVIPEIKDAKKVCTGHQKDFSAWKESTLKEEIEKFQKKLEKKEGEVDLSYEIDSSFLNLVLSYKTTVYWKHLDPDRACNKFHIQEKITREKQETDTWVLVDGNEEALKNMEADTDCILLQIQPSLSGTKTIQNIPIYRDAWKRKLIFSCAPSEESKCARLRAIGATLIKKQCLKTSDEGECLQWKKTFDLGKRAAFDQNSITIDQEALDYLEGFETSYEKNTEFGQTISTLASFSDMEAFDQGPFDPALVAVFSGDQKKCRRSLNSKHIFDCCYREEMDGRGIWIGLRGGQCNEEERDLFLAVQEGKCKKVGSISELLQTKHVYCCFPTKLSRIVQEEGRKQLGLSFGTAENPECQGLSVEQLGQIDFEKIDFTEFIEQLQEKINTQELAKRFKALAEDFAKKITPEQAQNNTSLILEAQEKRLEEMGRKTAEKGNAS